MEANSEADAQTQMGDSSQNPLLHDICRLFHHWRDHVYGGDDGKHPFDRLQGKVDQYNTEIILMEERLSYSGMKLQCQKCMMNLNRRHHQQNERSDNPLKSHYC